MKEGEGTTENMEASREELCSGHERRPRKSWKTPLPQSRPLKGLAMTGESESCVDPL